MAIYRGVDFHARQQLIMCCDTADGEIHRRRLAHADLSQVRDSYAHLHGEVVVGLEASGYTGWLETMLHQLAWIGEATEIRRRARSRHKNDRRDAE